MNIKTLFTFSLISSFVYSASIAQPKKEIDSEVVKTSKSPYAKLKSINLTDVSWTDGFWKKKVDLVRKVTIPYLNHVMHEEDQGKSVHNLEVAAGIKKGEYKGNNWQDAWLYKWIEMAVVSYAVTKDQDLEDQIDDLIATISKAQEDDGYISTNIQVRGEKRFQNPNKHEWYNMGHLLTAAALHHRITGKTNFLDVAKKVCQYGFVMFREHNAEMAHFPINPSIIMGAVEMYRETGNPQQLELAKMVIDIRGKYPNGSDNWQDKIPLREEKEVIGHAVWYTYLYAGAADVYMETGDKSLLEALDRLWHDLIQNKLYVHGGACALYIGKGVRKDGKLYVSDDVWESVGLPFQQPNAYGYNETCGQVGNFMWNYRMLNITGEARFAEIMENELYNGFLGSMGQDGKSFFYVNPLRWHAHEQLLLGNSALKRGIPGSENIGTCCPTNYSRTLVELQGMIYSKSENTFWIHHYGANTYDDGIIKLEQITQYPWEGKVELKIDQLPAEFTLKLRIPEWASGTEIKVNGKPIENISPGAYLSISSISSKKNLIIIDFPMEPKLIVGNPKIEETLNQVAIKRGPVLYAMEGVDLPSEIETDEVILPINTEFKPVHNPDFLHGVTFLEGQAKYFKKQNWEKTMYQELQKPEFKEFTLSLIPYFTWANRGISKMSVWIPIDY